jgi:hypothetical protein
LFIKNNFYGILLFVLFTVFSTANSLIDNVFIAFRNAKFVLIKNTVFSVLKLATPFFLLGLGAYGIFVSLGIATTISFLLGMAFLIWRFNYVISLIIDPAVIKKIFKFSLGNYVSGFIGGSPLMLLPILILNSIGAKFSAYFFIDFMIASFLYVVPTATSQSLFAESSHDGEELETHLAKAAKIIALILVPTIIIFILFGKYILIIFGRQYALEGTTLLQLLVLSSIFVSINLIFESILRFKKNIKMIIIINFFEALITLSLVKVLIPRGLVGIGLAILIGQGAASILYLSNENKLIIRLIQKMRHRGIPFIKERNIWSIGIYEGNSPFHLKSPSNIKNPVLSAKDITDVKALFVADPFILKEGEVWHMFFEVLNRKSKRGEIGYAKSEDGFKWAYEKIILKENCHLSYPYVFKWNDEFYMIPETIDMKAVRLYKAKNFPDQWIFVRNLLEGEYYSDSSLVYFKDTWWMFTSNEKSDILRLYTSKRLLGEWKKHPQSPLLEKNPHKSRPGGRVILYEDYMYRFTQDCNPTYGNKIRAFKIKEISETNYKEEYIEINPPIEASKKGWNSSGMHTVDPHLIGNNLWIASVDGGRRSFYFDLSL